MNKIVKHKWYWMALAVMTLVFYILNLNTSLWGDDYLYALMPNYSGERCDTISKFISTMPHYYATCNGRIADIIGRFFLCILGKDVFNVVSSLVFATFTHFIAKCVDNKHRVIVLLAIFFYILVLLPYPGETLLWVSGACNYLWSATLTIILLHIIDIAIKSGKYNESAIKHVALFAFALVAGGMNESVTTATLAGLIIFFAANRNCFKKKNITIFCGYLLGVMLIVCSPAAWHRLAHGHMVHYEMGALQLVASHTMILIAKTGHFITPFLGIVASIWLLWKKGWGEFKKNILVFALIGASISVFVYAVYADRFYTWYSICGFMVLLAAIADIKIPQHLVVITGIVLAVICIPQTHVAITSTHERKAFSDSILQVVLNSPDGVVKAAPAKPYNRFYHNLNYDNSVTTSWNRENSLYYQKDNIQYIEDSLLTRYQSKLPLTQGCRQLNMFDSSSKLASAIYVFDNNYLIIPLSLTGKATLVDGDARFYNGNNPETPIVRDYFLLKHNSHNYIILPNIQAAYNHINVSLHVNNELINILFATNEQVHK